MSEAAGSIKRRALGRGLSALISAGATGAPTAPERQVPIAEVHPNPRQPRRFFDEDRIAELAESIRRQGVLQPLVVRKADRGYELIIGERRFRAAQLAGLERIPVVIKEASDVESLEMALVENIQRAELTPIEEALAYRQLLEEFHLTQEDIATRVGKSRPAITNLLRVLNLPAEIREAVDRGTISVGHARTLLALETPDKQVEVARRVIRQGLSVRETETVVARSLEDSPSPVGMTSELSDTRPKEDEIAPARLELYFSALEEELIRELGTKVRVHPRKKGGRIEIEYYSNEELEKIVRRLKG
jgi:ParB family chromosome partitioning protein